MHKISTWLAKGPATRDANADKQDIQNTDTNEDGCHTRLSGHNAASLLCKAGAGKPS